MYADEFLRLLKFPMEGMFNPVRNAYGLVTWKYVNAFAKEGAQVLDMMDRTQYRFMFLNRNYNEIDENLAKKDLTDFYQNLSGIDLNLRGIDYVLNYLCPIAIEYINEEVKKSRDNEEFEKDKSILESGVDSFTRLYIYTYDLLQTQPWFFPNNKIQKGITKIVSQNIESLKKEIPQIKKISSLSDISWQEFEDVSGAYFNSLGFEVYKTRSSKDGGFDLLLLNSKNTDKPQRILVECKKYSQDNKVGVEIIRELYGVSQVEPSTQSICVTSSQFTEGAKDFSRITNGKVELVEGETILKWIKS